MNVGGAVLFIVLAGLCDAAQRLPSFVKDTFICLFTTAPLEYSAESDPLGGGRF